MLCSHHPNIKSPIDFRRAKVCPRSNSERFDEVSCVNNNCNNCSDLKLFSVCDCTAKEQLLKIKCQLWEKIAYECKDGTIKQKSDFRPREVRHRLAPPRLHAPAPSVARSPHHGCTLLSVLAQVSYIDFDTLLRKYWPKFQLHHDGGKWQDDE